MTDQPIVLLVTGEYPPYSAWGGNAYQMRSLAGLLNGQGFRVEVIAESDDGEEFTHLDDGGNLIHRVAASQSYLMKPLRVAARRAGLDADRFKDLAYALRVAEKAHELSHVWGRRLLWVETTNWRAESFFLHLWPPLNRRVLVRIVTPLEEVVRQNAVQRSLPIRVTLAQELIQQLLARERLFSNAEYGDYFRGLVRTRAPLVPPGREHTFLLPFDFSRVRRRAARQAGVESEPLRLLMIGRVEARKGFDVVCTALAALAPEERRRIRVVAVGRDVTLASGATYRAELEARFPQVARECLEFVGQVPDQDLQRHVDAADAGLVASTSESFGYNLVELLASDLPVVTSDVGAASELERRGVRYAGKFRTTGELAEILRTLPGRLRGAVNAPSNRDALEAMYRENDAAYLDHILSRVVRPGDRPDARATGAGPTAAIRSLDVVVCSSGESAGMSLERTVEGAIREAGRAQAAGIAASILVLAPGELPARRVRFVQGKGARGRNDALGSLSGDAVLFLEEGAVPEEGLFLAHARALEAFPRAVGVAGRVSVRGEAAPRARHVGQVRLSGLLDANHGSLEKGSVLVPLVPPAANVSFRRERMNALLGERWFDEQFDAIPGGLEVALGAELRRRGETIVRAVDAAVSLDAHSHQVASGELDGALLRKVFGHSPLAHAAALAIGRARAARARLLRAKDEAPAGGTMPSIRKLQKLVYRVPGVGYLAESLVALATLPRKLRDLNERLDRLEQAGGAAQDPDSVVATHIPAILNYITSFSHTSRELTRRFEELKRQVESAPPPNGDAARVTPQRRTASER